MKFPRWVVGLQRSCRAAVLVYPDRAFRRRSAIRRVAKGQETKSLRDGLLSMLAACLAVGLAACFILGALDPGYELWPFGIQGFSIVSQDQPMKGNLSAGALAALNVIQCFVMAGGAHLVWRRPRARSDLVNASPLVSSVLNVAEPGWLQLYGCPGARPFRFLDPGDGCNSRGRARAKDRGPLSGALSFISWFSSQADFSIFREARMLSGTAGAPTPSEMGVTLAGDGVPCRAGSGDSFRRVAWTSAGGRR